MFFITTSTEGGRRGRDRIIAAFTTKIENPLLTQ